MGGENKGYMVGGLLSWLKGHMVGGVGSALYRG